MPDPWWAFSLDPDSRADPDANRLRDADGRPLVNAPSDDGRLALDYAGYLGLDALLSAQHPASSVPDERVFIIVHQLCELVFRQMTFDLAVVAGTMERLLRLSDSLPAMALAEGDVDDEASSVSAFWRPAITAS
ncbi:MAG TPA: tryptophan 2,3-dioxygenase family protein, partial [Rubricoccaceae bacterium]